MIIHTGDMLLECNVCDKQFTLLHSERPKIAYNFGLYECNRVKEARTF